MKNQPTKKPAGKIELGNYQEQNFSSREAMCAEIERDVLRCMEAKAEGIKEERARIIKLLMDESTKKLWLLDKKFLHRLVSNHDNY